MFLSVAVLPECNVIETSDVAFPYMLAVAQQINWCLSSVPQNLH